MKFFIYEFALIVFFGGGGNEASLRNNLIHKLNVVNFEINIFLYIHYTFGKFIFLSLNTHSTETNILYCHFSISSYDNHYRNHIHNTIKVSNKYRVFIHSKKDFSRLKFRLYFSLDLEHRYNFFFIS